MRIVELIAEQTIGTTGSSAAPAPVTPVSQTPAAKPDASGEQQSQDPNLQKLAATLQQNKIIDNEQEINNFLSAYQASTTGKTLNPQQQGAMSNLASALLKNKSLDSNLDLQLKAMSVQKPGSAPTPPPTAQQAPGGM
jgi:hypothetical protein